MSKPKAIFIDIDGTLLCHKSKKVPASALDAMSNAHNQGVLLFIATGRHKIACDVIPCLQGLPLDGFVTMNGAYCHVTDKDADGKIFHKAIYKNPICRETVATAVEYIKQNPFPCTFCEDDDAFINMATPLVDLVYKALGLQTPPVCDPQRAIDSAIFQITVFCNAEEEAFLRSLPQAKLTKWMDGGFDMVNAAANKWSGILHMLEYFDISPQETAAIGDGENDIEMLSNAGFSVAMGNASDEVKNCAKFVTRNVGDDGLAEAIKYLLDL